MERAALKKVILTIMAYSGEKKAKEPDQWCDCVCVVLRED